MKRVRMRETQPGRLGAGATALFAVAIPATLHAQAVNPPTREELEIGRDASQNAVSASRLAVEGGIERAPCPLADPAYAKINVTFPKVEFGGLTAVDPQALAPAWQDMAGREVPIAALCEVRDRAATMLRDMGYLAAVQVPPQRIEKGSAVHMDVLVAKLVEVQVRGEAGHSEKLIAGHLGKLTARPWFNINEAERHLLLLGGLPGYDVRLTLRSAGKAPGEVIGDVLVNRQPIELVVGTQNLGTRASGREGVFAQLTLNDVTGMGDRTSVSIYNTVKLKEQTVAQISHDFALSSDGLRLGGSLVYGRGEPSIAGGSFKTKTLIGKLELSYPLVLRQSQALRAAGGVELANQSVDFGAVRLSKDKLRIAFARLDYDMVSASSLIGKGGYSASEPKWRFAASLEARQGISGLGASSGGIGTSNILAKPNAFVVRLESAMEFRPVPSVTLAVTPRFQYSPSQLLSFEQFSLGNYTIGRGYDPGIVLGDKGAGASFELRVGKIRPKTPKSVSLQPYGFYDAAWAWSNGTPIAANRQRVFSIGGGLRARWGDRMDANLVVAAPLRIAGSQTARGDVRMLFTLTARLMPWKQS